MKKILVTGGAGFIGSHILEKCSEVPGLSVTVLDNLSSGFKEYVPLSMNLVQMDVRDKALIDFLLQEKFDTVIHLAAQTLVPFSMEYPLVDADINIKAAQTGYVDMVDVEIFTGDDIVRRIIEGAHAAGVKVVASNHDFFKTPEKDDIVRRLCKMQEMGADIPKIAVMPQNKKDVLTLLAATEEMASIHADRPIITMSMAGTGVISRLCGEVFGSALTFGAAAKASAPGQMGVEDLKQVLTLLHGAL